MANFRCKMCGAQLDVAEGQTVAVCSFCGSKQTVANADDERKENLFNRANALRLNCEFDKAILSYQSILSLFPDEPEAHWGLCLCKYGIEYVDDPVTKAKKPTIHRMSFDSILKDSDYISALAYADVTAKEEYQSEAKEISDIQKNIMSISQKEEPFDIFICYKETDSNGKRTPDSVMAHEIYDELTNRGYKVFFSRVTLESKLGSMYEPYIFAALNSAKIMLVIGTKKEYFDAVWVRNEWSRFIDLMKTRPDHYLIPCFKGMDAYEMPEEFLSFQAQDLSKLGFMQDLVRGIDKIMGKEAVAPKAETKIIQTDINIDALLKRVEILIGDSNYEKADGLLERILDNDPTNSKAYLLELLMELHLNSIDQLKDQPNTFEGRSNFRRAYDFGDDSQKKKLDDINNYIRNRNEETRLSELYFSATVLKETGCYESAKEAFDSIANYKDSKEQSAECVELRKQQKYEQAYRFKGEKQYDSAIEIFEEISDFKDSEAQIVECEELKKTDIYEEAMSYKQQRAFDLAAETLSSISDFRDASFQIDECARLKEDARKEKIYKSCIIEDNVNYFAASQRQRIKKAIQDLSSIPGYKDSDQLIVKCEGLLKDYEKEMAIKREEAAKTKIKRAKQAKKVSLITGASALFLVGVMLLTFLYAVPEGRQNSIEKLIDSGNYDEAYSLIQKNGDYGDNSKLKSMWNAGKAFGRGYYDVGINYICDIGGSVDIAYDGNGGTVTASNETIKKAKNHITNEATRDGYEFLKWYIVDYEMDTKQHHASLSLSAVWELETVYRKALGIDPLVSADGKTLTYGLYPQTHVSDPYLIESLNSSAILQSNGWYLLYGAYYAKKSANPFSSSYKFDDGTTIVSGTTYWFKCEPIEWKILSFDNGTYSVVSSVLLDARRYDDSSNNYKDSEIREWLNGAFYDAAFSLDKDRIQTTKVDNSASTTDSPSNSYACDNTNDNVYLLSYKDYANTAYFADSDARQCKTTDWARANHAYCSTSSSYLHNGRYWTRSPYSNYSYLAWYVHYDGVLNGYNVGSSANGVRPALSLSIS